MFPFLAPKAPEAYSILEPWLGMSDPRVTLVHFSLSPLPLAGRGLLIENGQRWLRNRRLLTPAFHFDVLKPYVHVYNDCTDILLVRKRERGGRVRDKGKAY